MFKNADNYQYFLKQYDHYLSEVIETYAYCLLGDHFHLLVRIPEDLTTFQKLSNLSKLSNLNLTAHEIVSRCFRKFFQSYSMAFNKQQDRIGTLFQTPFKRALIGKDDYFTRLIYYIHANPQIHELTDDFRKWQWSSYNSILSDKSIRLKKQEVLDWFGGREYYIQFHTENQKQMDVRKFIIDDI